MKEVYKLVNIRRLKAQMTLMDITQFKLAESLGLSLRTMTLKMANPEKLTQKEMEKMIEILEIKNPISIFFDNR